MGNNRVGRNRVGRNAVNEVIAHIGLGTNLGNRKGNLRQALTLLSKGPGMRLLRYSQVYETEPWGVADQPRFLNCAAEIATALSPDNLLARCKLAERQTGRQPGPRWGARLIDVDILLYGDMAVDLPHLIIPHPRLHLRAFALLPLAELCGEAIHPLLGLSISEISRNVEGKNGVAAAGGLELALACPKR